MTPNDMKVAADVAAARKDCVIAPLPRLGMLVLTGADAVRFLHGQCTQDVKGAAPGTPGYAFLLDARGRNQGDFHFVVRGDGVAILVDRDRLEAIAAHLERFIIAADVRIARSPARATLVAGPACSRTAIVPSGDGFVVEDRSFGVPGFQVWDVVEPAVAGARPIGPDALEVLRIEAGLPRFGVDVDENVLPEESGQADRAVSYTKGCYAGQEVVAKQKYLGKPRKVLIGVLLDQAVTAPADLAGGEGRVTSCTWSPTLLRWIGLAMMKAPAPPLGESVATEAGVRATVAALPFVPPIVG